MTTGAPGRDGDHAIAVPSRRDKNLYDEIVRPAVDALAALEVDAEPVLRFAPLTPADTGDADDSDATR